MALSTTRGKVEDVLGLKFVSPLYTAVIACEAMVSELVVNVDKPPATVPVPSTVVPSLNVTEPEGVPAPGADTDTVAVKINVCPTTAGLADELTAIVVFALFTVCVKFEEVLPFKFVSPP